MGAAGQHLDHLALAGGGLGGGEGAGRRGSRRGSGLGRGDGGRCRRLGLTQEGGLLGSRLHGRHRRHGHHLDHLIRLIGDELQPHPGLAPIDHLQLFGRGMGEIDQALAAEGAAIVDPHYGLQPVVQVGDPHIARQRQVAVGGAEQGAVLHVAVGGLVAIEILGQPAGGALLAVVLDVAPHLVLLLADPVVPVAALAHGLGARYGTGRLRDFDHLGFFRLHRDRRRGSLLRLAATGGQQQGQREGEKFVAVMHKRPGLLD
ncbi:hypothetical protein D3C75_775040 [compost metagenome]